jgi:DAACS family dicarboxylate/amino acid:cation (Na+ or H+) symporter
MQAIMKPFSAWVQLAAWKKILIALVLGVMAGLFFGHSVDAIKPVGTLFINAIHMIVTPVVFTAIIGAVLSLAEVANIRQYTAKAFLLYAICMMFSATIGVLVALWIAPGAHFHPLIGSSSTVHLAKAPSFGQMLQNLIPSNPFAAFMHGNILQIIVLAILFGVAIRLVGKPADPVASFFLSLNKVVFKLTGMVISFAPYGIFALITWTVGHFGLQAITPLLKLVGAVYLGCFLFLIIVYSGGLLLFSKVSPVHFFKSMLPALLFAFTTSSSAATLPLTMKCTEEGLGLPKALTRFLLPLGASFNLNGLSIYLSVATIFAANMYGIHLGLSQYLTIVMTITFTAMGAAAVPGSALIVMSAVMSSVGIPLGAIAMIAGVDRLNDMMQTSTNVAGDAFVATLVSGSSVNVENDMLTDLAADPQVAD